MGLSSLQMRAAQLQSESAGGCAGNSAKAICRSVNGLLYRRAAPVAGVKLIELVARGPRR